jgi:hypothetical protein
MVLPELTTEQIITAVVFFNYFAIVPGIY